MTGPRASQGGTEAREAREAVYRGGASPRRRQAPACPGPPHARELRRSARAARRLFPGPSGQCRCLSQGRLFPGMGASVAPARPPAQAGTSLFISFSSFHSSPPIKLSCFTACLCVPCCRPLCPWLWWVGKGLSILPLNQRIFFFHPRGATCPLGWRVFQHHWPGVVFRGLSQQVQPESHRPGQYGHYPECLSPPT